MPFNFLVRPGEPSYKREFFFYNPESNMVHYYGAITVDSHERFRVEQLNTMKIIKEKPRGKKFIMNTTVPHSNNGETKMVLKDQKNTIEIIEELQEVDGIENIIGLANEWSRIEDINTKVLGHYLIQKGILLSK